MPPAALSRRHFLQTSLLAAIATPAGRLLAEPAASTGSRIPLGMDNFSVRSLGWKAAQLIDYAASLNLDTLFISDLDSYESLEPDALRTVRAKADAAGLKMYVGSWSICPTSTRYKKDWGTPAEHISTGLRVSKALGSPVFRVILGTMDDRKTPGGIEARIADTVKVLKASRSEILDSGIKIAIENHAGDMQSFELARLIEEAGPDIVGVNIDSGNAAWTLEDPLGVLETLGKYTICSSLRDEQIWQTPEGAAVQWTAMGDGVIDWNAYLAKWRELCPTVPVQIETISGGPRIFPYHKREFWDQWKNARAFEFERFVALAAKGHQPPPHVSPPGQDKKTAEQDYQKSELERSIRYCRETLGLGVRGR